MKKFKYVMIIVTSLFLLTGCLEEEERKPIMVIGGGDTNTSIKTVNLKEMTNNKTSANNFISAVNNQNSSSTDKLNYISDREETNGNYHYYTYKIKGVDTFSVDLTFNVEEDSLYSISYEINDSSSYKYFNSLRDAILKAADLYETCSTNEKCSLVLQDISNLEETESYISSFDNYLISLSVYNYSKYGEDTPNKYSFVIVNKK